MWVVAIIGALLGLMGFASLVLVGLGRAVLG